MRFFGGEDQFVISVPVAALTSPTDGYVIAYNATNDEFELVEAAGGGSGDVTAASAFATDNRLIRSDGTGKGVQATGITVSDSDQITGPGSLIISGPTAIILLASTGADVRIVNGNMYPQTNDSMSVGVTANRWRYGYFSRGVAITALTSDPGAVGAGTIVRADRATWDPLSLASGGSYLVMRNDADSGWVRIDAQGA
jgi:hypothetical protein